MTPNLETFSLDALPELILRYRPCLLSQARRNLFDPREAEEAVADTFITLTRQRNPVLMSTILGLLRTILSRRCVDRQRKLSRALVLLDSATLAQRIESAQDHAAPQHQEGLPPGLPAELHLWSLGYSEYEGARLLGLSRSGFAKRLKKQLKSYATNPELES